MPSSSVRPAIEIEGISKQYRLGQKERYKTVQSAIFGAVGRKARRELATRNPASFWALRDITFSVHEGEVMGIIGHNGAGKSTLLKILSRVTAPTEGRAEVRGRLGALLEVGTGFHPELTGRENVYLNGSVLGMSQAAVRSKFDEIVEFSEIPQFIDTPLKRYSSGMQVRLAFAVAAFLEPDVLIVDEVLAVGDVGFQRKCIGKLDATSSSGRTVLFVSHNLPAIRMLCPRSVLLSKGQVVFDGATEQAIAGYLETAVESERQWDLSTAERPTFDLRHGINLTSAALLDPSDSDVIPVGGAMTLRIWFKVDRPTEEVVIVINVSTFDDLLIAQTVSTTSHRPFEMLTPGDYSVDMTIDSTYLQPGRYIVGFGIRSNYGVEDRTLRSGIIEFVESEEVEFPAFGSADGYIRLRARWSAPTIE